MLLLTLATGTIERFPQGDTGFDEPQLPLPVWRTPGEFSYVKHAGARNELVVARRGSSEMALSASWPARQNAATRLSLADAHEAALNSACECHRALENFHRPSVTRQTDVPNNFVHAQRFAALPPLPPELVPIFGRSLVPSDHHANLIVDVLPGADSLIDRANERAPRE